MQREVFNALSLFTYHYCFKCLYLKNLFCHCCKGRENEWDYGPPLINWAKRTSWRWWDEMTLPSRHRIINSRPGGLRPSTLPLGHGGSSNIESSRMSGEETSCFFETWRPEWGLNPRSPTFQAGSSNPCTRAPILEGPRQVPTQTHRIINPISPVDLGNIVENVIKAPNLVQSCTKVYYIGRGTTLQCKCKGFYVHF